MLNDLNF